MFLKKLFQRTQKKKKEESENNDVVVFARNIEKRIDQATLEIFWEYREILLSEQNIYIVPAVWGAMKDGELSPTQNEIHARLSPVIKDILEILYSENISDEQKFAIAYIVRGLFISKIIYMIEFYKNLSNRHTSFSQQFADLKDIEPLGRA